MDCRLKKHKTASSKSKTTDSKSDKSDQRRARQHDESAVNESRTNVEEEPRQTEKPEDSDLVAESGQTLENPGSDNQMDVDSTDSGVEPDKTE